MSENTAPHLPDESSAPVRLRWLFVIALVVSILGGVAGGAYAMRMFLPGLLSDLIETLPLSNHTQRNAQSDVVSPFVDMLHVTHLMRSSNGTIVGSAFCQA